jgi:hypothetical protein
MAPTPHRVYVVVARDFGGEQLVGLERGIPICIVDSAANNPVIRRLWNERPDHDHLTGITAFNDVESASSTELLLGKLDSIDLHHARTRQVHRTPLSKSLARR